MPVQVVGPRGPDHTVTIDAISNWPHPHLTCTCGWEETVTVGPGDDALLGSAMETALAVSHHVGGPATNLNIDGLEQAIMDDPRLDAAVEELNSRSEAKKKDAAVSRTFAVDGLGT